MSEKGAAVLSALTVYMIPPVERTVYIPLLVQHLFQKPCWLGDMSSSPLEQLPVLQVREGRAGKCQLAGRSRLSMEHQDRQIAHGQESV